jgi:DNA-binding IclR family transcriptional regulator
MRRDPGSTDAEPEQGLAYSVPPVVRAIKLLRHIAAGNPVSNQTRAARELGLSRTTLLRLLHTLEREGFIEKSAAGDDYTLGTGLIELAAGKILSLDVARVSDPVLTRLARTLGLSCHLGMLDEREVVYVLRAAPNKHLVSNVHVGTRLPAHASSMGRVILAHMPTEDVEELFEGAELFPVTDKTPTTLPALQRDLAAIRASGLADSRSTYEIGIDSIAAPVFDAMGKVVGAINASGPERSFAGMPGRRHEISQAVLGAAAEIGHRLGHSSTDKAPLGLGAPIPSGRRERRKVPNIA